MVSGLSLKSTSSYSPGSHWQPLPIGGGGFSTGLSMSNDGQTVIVRTDTAGAYVWNESKAIWTSITNANVLPVGYVYGSGTGGTYDCIVAPNNNQIIYQMLDGFLLKSTNAGKSFVALTTFNGGVQLNENTAYANGGTSRLYNYKMAVDPNNANVLVVGTGINGVFITKDGGTTWAPLSVPVTCPQDFWIVPLKTSVVASNQLTFNSISGATTTGLVYDLTTPASIPAGTTVVSKNVGTNTITISNSVTVTAGDSLLFCSLDVKSAPTSLLTTSSAVLTFTTAPTVSNGFCVIDLTNLNSIPVGTTVIGSTATTVTLSTSVTVASGDVIGLFNPNTGTIDYSGYCIAFDPISSVVGSGLTAATQGIYIAPWNSPIQQSTNGGTSFTPLTSGVHPTTCQCLVFDSSGNMWVASQNNDYSATGNSNVWKFTAAGATFTNYTSAQTGVINPTHAIAADPNNIGHVALMSAAGIGLSFTVDTFAHTLGTFSSVTISNDASWLNAVLQPSCGWLMFHPTRTGELWCAQGVGVMRLVVPTSIQAITWNGIVNGIESLTNSHVLNSPGCKTHLTVWDRGIFRIDNILAPATSTSWITNNANIILGSGCDYASSDPTFLVACAAFGTQLHSAYSTDSGLTWTEFTNQQNGYSGCITASTPNSIIWVPSATGGAGLPLLSTDLGVNWTLISGLPATGNGYFGAYFNNAVCVCSDKNYASAPNTFYISYQNSNDAGNGIWKSTNGGVTWIQTCGNGVGTPSNGKITNTRSRCTLSSVPNEPAGTLLYCGAAGQGVNGTLKISTDGNGAVWTNVNALLTNVTDFGYGMAAPGASHVALYIIGTYNGSNGIFISNDLGATINPILNNWTPAGVLTPPSAIGGDFKTYGRVYVSCNGFGWVYRNYVSG